MTENVIEFIEKCTHYPSNWSELHHTFHTPPNDLNTYNYRIGGKVYTLYTQEYKDAFNAVITWRYLSNKG